MYDTPLLCTGTETCPTLHTDRRLRGRRRKKKRKREEGEREGEREIDREREEPGDRQGERSGQGIRTRSNPTVPH
jgi:hypothetical protein